MMAKTPPVDEVAKRRRLSQQPPAIRQRVRRASKNAEADTALLREVTMQRYKPIDEWDLDELAHGKPRNEDGRFSGGRPKWITPIIEEEVRRRLRHETLLKFDRQAASAVKVLADFLMNDEEPQLRFKAAQLILEYVVGKPEQKLNVNGNLQLQSMLAGALVLPSGEDAHPMILPGEFTEEEPDDDGE
jgi:hypothetical protein